MSLQTKPYKFCWQMIIFFSAVSMKYEGVANSNFSIDKYSK